MNNALKLALVGIAAWWLWQRQTNQSAQAQPAPLLPQPADPDPWVTAPVNAAPVTPPAMPAAPAADDRETALTLAATWPQLAHLAAGEMLTADQWNWYNAQGSGQQTILDLFQPGARSDLIAADEYWRRRLAAGLSGTGGERMTAQEYWRRRLAAVWGGAQPEATWVN